MEQDQNNMKFSKIYYTMILPAGNSSSYSPISVRHALTTLKA